MNKSFVSVVMPCFIRDERNLGYFRQALDSALAQEYSHFEILVINDGSPLSAELESLDRLRSPQVRYLKKPNGGVASALNTGLQEMRGEFFTWLSHDDLYLPGKVNEQVKAATDTQRKDLVFYCDVEHVDADGNHLFFERTPDLASRDQVLFFAQFGCFNANSYLVPRHCFEVAGPFDEGLRTTQDNHMWFRIARHFTSVRVPQVLMKYRNHPTQDSRSPIHLRECNDLFTFFLRNISREDVLKCPHRSPARYFAECACLRRNRGYLQAERYALRRAAAEWIRKPWTESSTLRLILRLVFSAVIKSSIKSTLL